MTDFKYKEDRIFFEQLILNHEIISKIEFESLFDFRDLKIKRKEFNSIRNEILEILTDKYGLSCMLGLECCDSKSGFAIDHLVPLSSNELNKKIRNLIPLKGKKVESQSFGSNRIENLILSCNRCNNHKKHRFLNRDQMKRILANKKKIKIG